MPRKDRPVIYRNLSESPYRLTMEGITFHFSSVLHLIKFKEGVDEFTETLEEKLHNRYGIKVRFPVFCALAYYRITETRGFLVYNHEGRRIVCPKLKLSGNPENVSE